MRLDAQRDKVLEKRRGFARRTIFATIWFVLCIVGSYFLVDYLFDNDIITYTFFYRQLSVPANWDQRIILAGVIFVLVVAINFIVLVGFSFFSFEGRRRPGDPSLYSQDPDRDDQKYNYR